MIQWYDLENISRNKYSKKKYINILYKNFLKINWYQRKKPIKYYQLTKEKMNLINFVKNSLYET